jgi:hypothetical protein
VVVIGGRPVVLVGGPAGGPRRRTGGRVLVGGRTGMCV